MSIVNHFKKRKLQQKLNALSELIEAHLKLEDDYNFASKVLSEQQPKIDALITKKYNDLTILMQEKIVAFEAKNPSSSLMERERFEKFCRQELDSSFKLFKQQQKEQFLKSNAYYIKTVAAHKERDAEIALLKHQLGLKGSNEQYRKKNPTRAYNSIEF